MRFRSKRLGSMFTDASQVPFAQAHESDGDIDYESDGDIDCHEIHDAAGALGGPSAQQCGDGKQLRRTGLGLSSVFDIDSVSALRWSDATGAAGVEPGDAPPTFRWRCSAKHIAAVWSRSAPRLLWWSLNVYNVIELLSVLPFFVDLANEVGLGRTDRQASPLRVARFLCLLRLLRFTSDSTGMRLLGRAIISSSDTLRGSFLLACVSAAFFSMGLFLCEQGTWDEASQQWLRADTTGALEPSPFSSVPAAAWFTVVTMTTVGYGDMAPTTVAGRVLCICCIAVGVLVLAVPATIVGFNLAVELEMYKVGAERRMAARLARMESRLLQRGRERGEAASVSDSPATPSRIAASAPSSIRILTGPWSSGSGSGGPSEAASLEGLRAEVRELRSLLQRLLLREKA